MKSALLLILLFLYPVTAQSQPPTPTPVESRHAPQSQTKPAPNEPDGKDSPSLPGTIAVHVQNGSVGRTDNPQEQQRAKQDSESSLKWWSDLGMLILTGVMAVFTALLWLIAKRQAEMIHTIERAYVTMSHHPPGVDFGYGFIMSSDEKPAQHRELTIRAEIRNYGNTPATITDVSLRHYVGADLPDTPEYLAGPRVTAFLVKDNAFTVARQFSIREERIAEMAKGNERLWVYGYVDYIDQFRQRHRAGYARVYDRSMDDTGLYKNRQGQVDEAAYRGRNNLPFAVKPRYNYDRKRDAGEGKD